MPDHGLRVPPYLSGNLAQGILGQAPYGWTGTPQYRTALLPANDYFPADQFAYERIDWDNFKKQQQETFGGGNPLPGHYSNPNFLGASQMINRRGDGTLDVPDWMRRPNGEVARILRGFIRRQEVDPSDKRSFVRLMFMWNPDELRRQYMSVADNPVLDATGNLGVASGDEPLPPAQVEIQFTLYFDRQAEVATIADHPGVLVDLQAFDVLGGAVSSTGTQQYGGSLSDPVNPQGDQVGADPGTTAVGMVPEIGSGGISLSPTKITAVFAPTLAFYGVLTAAEAVFTKFSSRMVPTAMTLTINMTLLSIGNSWTSQTLPDQQAGASGAGPSNPEIYNPDLGARPTTPEAIKKANESGGPNAINWGLQYLGTPYERDFNHRMDGPPTNNKTFRSDCSSFVWRCYKAIGWTNMLGLGNTNAPNTDGFISAITSHPNVWKSVKLRGLSGSAKKAIIEQLWPGDIFVRGWSGGKPGHIVMYSGFTSGSGPSYDNKNCLKLHSTPEQVIQGADGKHPTDPVTGKALADGFEYWARPVPFK